jgi:16S rRNA (guanine(966)-N(2))-methyltransferase RsmD
MRVIAGTLKGRRLRAPTWSGLRPTSDKLRGTLFNILGPRISGARVLDLFAGTGALGIEALSRGARAVTFIEEDPRAQALIAANLAHCGIRTGYTVPAEPEGRARVIDSSVARGLRQVRAVPAFAPFDVVLLDPPYDLSAGEALAGLDTVLAPDGILVLEHARRQQVPDTVGRLVRVRQVHSGDSMLTFYALCPP